VGQARSGPATAHEPRHAAITARTEANMIKGFKDFLLRGNVIDLAVAVVIGAAFATLVTAFTNNLINPIISAAGSQEVGVFGFSLRHGTPQIERSTLINVGAIIGACINFVIVAAIVYFVFVAPVNALMERRKRGQEPPVEATPEDIKLLQEIRDLLRARNGQV
jgi:large conductance mechanosensitive channel